ncbi:MAG: hypothetical protein H6Q89_3124, partial [Myxococcaceae bacterium]|nr:hypothetical protein [Myxococcaceae bacterium]
MRLSLPLLLCTSLAQAQPAPLLHAQ